MLYRLTYDSKYGLLHLDFQLFQVAMRHLVSLTVQGRQARISRISNEL